MGVFALEAGENMIKKNEEIITEVRQRSDIVSVISSYVKLNKAGKNYKGLCPFHNEKTPSFTVNPEKQMFYCFGCGAGGNVFNFIMLKEGLNFKDAVQFLAERAGIDINFANESPEEIKRRQEIDRILQLLNDATSFFQYHLWNTPGGVAARSYLIKRGVSEEIIRRFQLGLAPGTWDGLLNTMKKKGYSPQLIEKAGLVIKRSNNNGYYDRFRDRVIFPICNFYGKPIGFGGRVLDNSLPKYLNSPETPVFQKGKQLYGLNLAKEEIIKKDYAIIMEGYMDVVKAFQFNINNCVASLGTSLTQEQAKLIRSYTKNTYIAYDGDAAGQAATQRGLQILKDNGCEVRIIAFPEKMDPDEYLSQRGKDAFLELISTATPLTEYKLNVVIGKYDLNSIEQKNLAAKDSFQIISELSEAVEIEGYLQQLAEKLKINEQVIRREFRKFLQKGGKYRNQPHINETKERNNNVVAKIPLPTRNAGVIKAERALLTAILLGQCGKTFIEEIDESDFILKEHKEIFVTFLSLSKPTDKVPAEELIRELSTEEAKKIAFQIYIEGNNQVIGEEISRSYLKKMRIHSIDSKISKIKTLIKEAERKNDINTVNDLLIQQQILETQKRKNKTQQ